MSAKLGDCHHLIEWSWALPVADTDAEKAVKEFAEYAASVRSKAKTPYTRYIENNLLRLLYEPANGPGTNSLPR